MTELNISINLNETLGGFVHDRVASGEFLDASEVVGAGLALLKRKSEREQRKLARLNMLIQEGLDDLEAGRYTDVTDLGRWFDELEAEAEARATATAA
jgi:antitoxin ParD1/3/4